MLLHCCACVCAHVFLEFCVEMNILQYGSYSFYCLQSALNTLALVVNNHFSNALVVLLTTVRRKVFQLHLELVPIFINLYNHADRADYYFSCLKKYNQFTSATFWFQVTFLCISCSIVNISKKGNHQFLILPHGRFIIVVFVCI